LAVTVKTHSSKLDLERFKIHESRTGKSWKEKEGTEKERVWL